MLWLRHGTRRTRTGQFLAGTPSDPAPPNPATADAVPELTRTLAPCCRGRLPDGRGAGLARIAEGAAVTLALSPAIRRPLSAPPSPRRRSASSRRPIELFYDDGIRTVGVDRLISESAVTKATFYKHYGSKDRLIVAVRAVPTTKSSTASVVAGHVDGTTTPSSRSALMASVQRSRSSMPRVSAAARSSTPPPSSRTRRTRCASSWSSTATGTSTCSPSCSARHRPPDAGRRRRRAHARARRRA